MGHDEERALLPKLREHMRRIEQPRRQPMSYCLGVAAIDRVLPTRGWRGAPCMRSWGKRRRGGWRTRCRLCRRIVGRLARLPHLTLPVADATVPSLSP